MMKLKIMQMGEPVLREMARELSKDEILSDEIQQLIAHMRDTMHDAPGVGLAAPQIGQSLQLIVIEDRSEYHAQLSPEQLAERERVPVPFQVIINPKLTILKGDSRTFFEGCLSFSGFVGLVPRAQQVQVECLNERAEPVTITAHGWYARILQHEVDHLHGKICIDRMHTRSLSTMDNFMRYHRHKTTAELIAELTNKS
jgi:peptide deformylase